MHSVACTSHYYLFSYVLGEAGQLIVRLHNRISALAHASPWKRQNTIFFFILILISIYLSTAIGLAPGGSTHLVDTRWQYTFTRNTQNITINNKTSRITNKTTQITNLEECWPCPVFVNYTLAFALQLREKIFRSSDLQICRVVIYINGVLVSDIKCVDVYVPSILNKLLTEHGFANRARRATALSHGLNCGQVFPYCCLCCADGTVFRHILHVSIHLSLVEKGIVLHCGGFI
jgi:hypothetical protein